MTLEQMEAEITGLRDTVLAMQKKDEARQKNWRSLRFAATFLGLLYICASTGFLVAGLLLSRHEPLVSGLQFALLFTAFPTILLANVLREPKPNARAEMEATLRSARRG